MHVSLEEMIGNKAFNEKVSALIAQSGRKA